MSDEREQKVRERAYAIWEENGGEHGRHDDHWARAELEIEPAHEQADTTGEEKSPMEDPGSPGGTAGTGGTSNDQDR